MSRRRGRAASITLTTASTVGSWPGPVDHEAQDRRAEEHRQVQVALEALGGETAGADLDRHRQLRGQRPQVAPLAVAQGLEREVVGDLDAAERGGGRPAHEVRGGQRPRRLAPGTPIAHV